VIEIAALATSKCLLDPVENISTAVRPAVGDGRHRRAYLAASTSEGWGEQGHTCGAQTLVHRASDYVQIAPVLCDRWSCRLCGPRRVAWLKREIVAARPRHNLHQFWTLPLDTNGCTAPESFEHIQASWNRLRKTLVQHYGPFSYVWTVEATKRGYAHLHLLTSLKISRSRLSNLWRVAARGSYIVYAEPASSERAANYLAKYCVKQATLRQSPEWAHLANKRMFSKSRDIKFAPFRGSEGTSDKAWEVVGVPYWEMAARLRAGRPVLSQRIRGVPALTVGAVRVPSEIAADVHLAGVGPGPTSEAQDAGTSLPAVPEAVDIRCERDGAILAGHSDRVAYHPRSSPRPVPSDCGREAQRSGVLNWQVRGGDGGAPIILSPPLGVARAAPPTRPVKGASEPLTGRERPVKGASEPLTGRERAGGREGRP